MKKFFVPVTIVSTLSFLFLISTSLKAKPGKMIKAAAMVEPAAAPVETEANAKAFAEKLYDSLQLDALGLKQEVLTNALAGQEQMAERNLLKNDNILTICDFSQSSKKKRLYVIDVENYKVLVNTYVAHGKNSGLQTADRFSNIPESLQSSLGFYVTSETYSGKHGLSLRLDGVEAGFNDNARARAIVMHGADYIGANRLNAPYMGRSFGCPAVPRAESKEIINLLKEGTCLFVYHPDKNYLSKSKLLNS